MFNPRSSMVICPACQVEHPPAYQLPKCAHKDCEAPLCGRCAQACRCCPASGPLCEEHIYPSTLNGALSRPIGVCGGCLDDDFDEVLAGAPSVVVPVCSECRQACLTINEVENPDGRCWGCREEEKRKAA